MSVRNRDALLVAVLVALFVSPGLSRATSAGSADNAAAVPHDTLHSTSPLATDLQKTRFWTGLWNSMTDEAHLTMSYGILEASLTIRRKSDGAQATMVQRDSSAVFLSYSTRSSFFKDSNFGYTFMVNYVDFDMGRQEIHQSEYADLGTHITGRMIYAVPTLYYQWGDHLHKGIFVRLGVGAGFGAATYSGTIQLTGSQVPGGEKIYTSNSSLKPGLALSNFIEARWRHFGISMSYAAPRISRDEYDVKVSDFAVNIGYTYYF
jgi:hypothetical protein